MMPAKAVLFTQPGCLSCELMKVFLEAKEIAFEERDISVDAEARKVMMEQHGSNETPTLVLVVGDSEEVIVGFDPELLDQFLSSAP
ncbi:MAG TPA: glutaredoxin domain-containing protein [Candidatus Sulfotelmatobacter sp.]|nr:glutaredoxin domain-containing protein [Candidatus Sulfotelmatobacter sp.]